MNNNENKTSRKDFLKKTAVVGLGIGVGSSHSLSLKAFSIDTNSKPKKKEGEWLPTTCQGCTSWCSVQVYVEEGRVIKVRGNPHSKVNEGNACVRSHMSLQQVYDPDRLKTPMKRTNPEKGRDKDPKFIPISWDDALNEIADKILELRENKETHKYMLMRGRYTYMRDIIYDRMTKIIGSPNNISHSAICAEAEKFGPFYTEGYWGYRQYDILNTKYILLWGADPLAANRQVSFYSKHWGDVSARVKTAVVDPRLSATAAKSNEWLPLKPGTDGALASAIAYIILTGGLWNKEFVGDFKDGKNRFIAGKKIKENDFKEIHTYGVVKWWNLELIDKTPEWAAKETGLNVRQIKRVALDFAKAAPHAISWVGGGPVMQVRGGYSSMACHALNGLVGSVDNVGGTMESNKVHTKNFPKPNDFIDKIAKNGKKHKKIDGRGSKDFPALKKGKPGEAVVTNHAADGIINRKPNEIKVAIGYMNNFAFSCPETLRWEKALSMIPFVVHLTTHASEFTWFSDIVLPCAHHKFEKYGYVKSIANGYTHVTLNLPVVKPFLDVRQDETEVPWLLAEKLAAKGFENLLNHYKTYKDPETGREPANAAEFALYSLKYATQNLWDPAKYKGGDKFDGWEAFRKVGVSNSDPYPFKKRWEKGFKTKTKKFEFYSETLKAALHKHAEKKKTTIDDILETCKYQAHGEKAFVPHYEEPFTVGSKKTFPLIFVDYKSRLNREGRSCNTEWYHDMKDLDPGDEKLQDVAKFNPIDAKKYGLCNGDHIKLISKVGELECQVKVWEGVRPGTVSKAYGQGHWAYGSIASDEFGVKARGGNNNAIIPAEYDRLSGSTAYYGIARVRVEKI